MLRIAAVFFLAAALVLDVTRASYGPVSPDVFMFTGLALLVLAVIIPPANVTGGAMHEPHFGHTRHGLAVHQRTADHHPAGTAYQRFNKRVATTLTRLVGTMTCFWIFCGLALCSLPAVLSGFSLFSGVFPGWMVRASDIALIAWIAQTFIQLVLLPALMVGQSLQNEASDARSAKTFEDIEAVRDDLTVTLDRLDEKTKGGIKAVLDAVAALATPPAQLQSAITLNGPQIKQLVAAIQANTLASQAVSPPKAPAAKRMATPAERVSKGKTT